jgi:hypothetical protein
VKGPEKQSKLVSVLEASGAGAAVTERMSAVTCCCSGSAHDEDKEAVSRGSSGAAVMGGHSLMM